MFLWILSRYSISYWVEIHSAVDEMESENTMMEHDIHRILYVLSDYKAQIYILNFRRINTYRFGAPLYYIISKIIAAGMKQTTELI